MVFTSNIELSTIKLEKPSIFLAGSMAIGDRMNWRTRAINTFEKRYHLFDPTNVHHADLNDSEMSKHIKWEWEALKHSDAILFNFNAESKSPISLLELGMYIRSEKIVVVCPKEFYQSHYIETLCSEEQVPLFQSIEEVLNRDIFQLINK